LAKKGGQFSSPRKKGWKVMKSRGKKKKTGCFPCEKRRIEKPQNFKEIKREVAWKRNP